METETHYFWAFFIVALMVGAGFSFAYMAHNEAVMTGAFTWGNLLRRQALPTEQSTITPVISTGTTQLKTNVGTTSGPSSTEGLIKRMGQNEQIMAIQSKSNKGCDDTDNGFNPLMKGSLINAPWVTDKCFGDVLFEWDGCRKEWNWYYCAYGCNSGQCKAQSDSYTLQDLSEPFLLTEGKDALYTVWATNREYIVRVKLEKVNSDKSVKLRITSAHWGINKKLSDKLIYIVNSNVNRIPEYETCINITQGVNNTKICRGARFKYAKAYELTKKPGEISGPTWIQVLAVNPSLKTALIVIPESPSANYKWI